MDSDLKKKILAHSKQEMLGLTKMLSKTVHDINNPLAVMIGQLSIFELMQERGKLTEEKLQVIIEKLNNSSKLFKERLDDLRGYYKVSQNNEQYEFIHKVFHAINYYFENQFYTENIIFEFNCSQDVKAQIDIDNLLYCIKALIQNSIESLSQLETESKTIKLTCQESSNNMLEFIIQDSGNGLDQELSKILEWGHTTKSLPHSGLGLSIAEMLLNDVNSTLKYEKTTEYTQFSFQIPYKNA